MKTISLKVKWKKCAVYSLCRFVLELCWTFGNSVACINSPVCSDVTCSQSCIIIISFFFLFSFNRSNGISHEIPRAFRLSNIMCERASRFSIIISKRGKNKISYTIVLLQFYCSVPSYRHNIVRHQRNITNEVLVYTKHIITYIIFIKYWFCTSAFCADYIHPYKYTIGSYTLQCVINITFS